MGAVLNRVDNGYLLLVDGTIVATDNDKLSKENCDEIFGMINILDLAERNSKHSEEDYIEGFNKAVELNKDKVFTEADMIKFADDVYKLRKENKIFEGMPKLLQSLQQPTEIEVEIEMVSIGHCNCPCHKYNNMTHFNPCCYPKQVYKLDENSCLILSKKK
jgi:hypothetical protein